MDEQAEVGVGPWQGPWPQGTHWDPELLRHGDRRVTLPMTREEVRALPGVDYRK